MRSGPTRVEALAPRRHRVGDFGCGNANLDRWIHAYAGQAQRRDVGRTFVAVDEGARVLGYYTLVAGQVEHAEAPGAVRTGVSRHSPTPVGLVARLAVATSWQGKGLGTDLMRDAMRRLLAASEEVGMRAILVHAVDGASAGFYARLGFEATTPDRLTLMVPLAVARKQLLT